MKHRLLVCASLVVVIVAGSIDLGACGDKFFRAGRGARNNRYVAIHPARVLLYAPANTSAEVMKDFESALSRAGHTPRSVRGMDGLAAALVASRYDIVIVAGFEAAAVSSYLSGRATPPQVVPMVDPDAAPRPEIERQYPHILKAGAGKHEILEELDHVMSVAPPRAQR